MDSRHCSAAQTSRSAVSARIGLPIEIAIKAAQKRKAKMARAKAATRNLMKAARRRGANPARRRPGDQTPRASLGARPSNSQQAEVLEFYCRMAHQAGVIQQLCPVGCIILSLSELLGRAPSTESSTPPCNKGLRNARSDESADRFDFCDDH